MIRRGVRFRQVTFALAALVLLMTMGGCGYKDKPVPPQHVVPKPVVDLRVELDEKGATLFWAYPRETVTGGAVDEIDRFDLYRAEIPVATYCKTCPVPYEAPIAVPGGSLPPEGGKTAIFEATGLRPGNLYFFKVRSKAGWWRQSEDSNEVSFLWQTPPLTPEGLTVAAGDGKNVLKWQPVSQNQDGTPLQAPVLYQIYRGVDGGSVAKIGEPVASPTYTDTGVENGRTYSYQVQAVNTYNQGTVSSGLGDAIEASPVDRTPPPVPGGVAAITTEVGVKVYWDHVESPDLAGYRVYRRAEGEAKAVLAGEVNLPFNLFVDAKAPRNIMLFYAVTSIDTRNPANESARPAEVRVDQ
jgi:hypothetical protein